MCATLYLVLSFQSLDFVNLVTYQGIKWRSAYSQWVKYKTVVTFVRCCAQLWPQVNIDVILKKNLVIIKINYTYNITTLNRLSTRKNNRIYSNQQDQKYKCFRPMLNTVYDRPMNVLGLVDESLACPDQLNCSLFFRQILQLHSLVFQYRLHISTLFQQ